MSNFKALIKKVVGDKKEYKEYKRRIAALPAEYRQVFQEIEKYAWHFSDHSGANMFNALTDLLDLFEEGAANGTPIKNITKKNAKKVQVFQRVANQFEFGKEYTEKEVNQRLREIYEDYALLRRYLVDYQYLERDKFGKIYQKCEQHTKII